MEKHLTLLDVDLKSRTYEIIGKVELNPDSIKDFSEYNTKVHMDLIEFEKFEKLAEQGRIYDGSLPTKITFSSGYTIIVAEHYAYVRAQIAN